MTDQMSPKAEPQDWETEKDAEKLPLTSPENIYTYIKPQQPPKQYYESVPENEPPKATKPGMNGPSMAKKASKKSTSQLSRREITIDISQYKSSDSQDTDGVLPEIDDVSQRWRMGIFASIVSTGAFFLTFALFPIIMIFTGTVAAALTLVPLIAFTGGKLIASHAIYRDAGVLNRYPEIQNAHIRKNYSENPPTEWKPRSKLWAIGIFLGPPGVDTALVGLYCLERGRRTGSPTVPTISIKDILSRINIIS